MLSKEKLEALYGCDDQQPQEKQQQPQRLGLAAGFRRRSTSSPKYGNKRARLVPTWSDVVSDEENLLDTDSDNGSSWDTPSEHSEGTRKQRSEQPLSSRESGHARRTAADDFAPGRGGTERKYMCEDTEDEYVPGDMEPDPGTVEYPRLVKPLFSSEDSPILLAPHPDAPTRATEKPPWPTKALSVPAAIARCLREYQREGVQWLHKKYRENHGGVLGDDVRPFCCCT